MDKKIKDFLKFFFIWFAIFYLFINLINSYLHQNQNSKQNHENEILISPVSSSLTIGNLAEFKIKNHLQQKVHFISPCEPKQHDNFKVFRIINGEDIPITKDQFKNCGKKEFPNFSLDPNSDMIFVFKDFNNDFFSEAGKYKIKMLFNYDNKKKIITSDILEYTGPGVFRMLFRALVSRPLFNTLAFLIKILPGHSLGWAIIILTILVRIALFFPNQKAMRSQRELQKLQPKIDELRKKYGKNQQMIALKTMELYKTHKVNPMKSCLPMLFQMPFLLGLYYLVSDGLSPHLEYLLYFFQKEIDLTLVDNNFLIWDLSQNPKFFILPILVGVTQFLAIKLSTYQTKKKQAKIKTVVPSEGMAAQMAQMQTMMQWIMPIMIGFFTFSFPAGVGLYWLVSTLFGVIQQQFVNHQLDKPQVRRKK